MRRKLGGPFTGNGSFFNSCQSLAVPLSRKHKYGKLIKSSLKNNMGWNNVICILYQILSSGDDSL